ncbi:hypothetical protein Q2T41_17980 [Maribacter confluentis]|uniref:TonB C-terminal domain-containing protein n=1 Tax=Maribacter confluentis TaxID=1656093 RepID=A0ABT8RW47_9FLAO|nr:hypothetical protein [Maribacter confluentis]MDO1514547.1 hypothetical protein [Maribacter confluentis]
MKIKFLVFTLFLSSQIFGQSQKDSIADKSNFIEYSVITNSCKSVSNWNSKKSCSKRELAKEIQKVLNQDVLDKIPENKYRIRCTFNFDSNGELINANANTENDILNAEVLRAFKNLELNMCLMDENGTSRKGEFRIPIFIRVEK